MPCNADPVCNREDIHTYDRENVNPTGTSTVFANMGWVGFARLIIPELTTSQGNILRVNSADVNMKQTIEMPEVIDGRIDRSVYQLGPKTVDGTLSMPVVADIETGGCPTAEDLRTGVTSQLLDNIWCWATARGGQGRLLYHDASLHIRYANHVAYKFDKCIASTLGMSVSQGDALSMDIGVIGLGREAFP